jgi:cytochrome c553
MQPLVAGLSDTDVEAIAKHFAALEPKASGEAIDPALAERGAFLAGNLRCASCHRADLSGQNQMPRLARQRVDYMMEAMKALRDDKRSGADTMMTAVLLGLSDADLAALAHYAAGH